MRYGRLWDGFFGGNGCRTVVGRFFLAERFYEENGFWVRTVDSPYGILRSEQSDAKTLVRLAESKESILGTGAFVR